MPDLESLADVAAILALPVTVLIGLGIWWLGRRDRPRRALTCSFEPIISPVEIRAGAGLDGDIGISYKGQSVDNMFVVRARLINSGNQAIRQADVVAPLTFVFLSGAELLREPQTVIAEPGNLAASWTVGGPDSGRPNRAQLDFELLNPGDALTVQFTCTGESGLPRLEARISGIREIPVVDPKTQSQARETAVRPWRIGLQVLSVSLFVSGLFLVLFTYFIDSRPAQTVASVAFLSAFVATIAVGVVGSVYVEYRFPPGRMDG